MQTFTQSPPKEDKLIKSKVPRRSQNQTICGRIQILATSDLHMNLASFDYYADRPDPAVGFTRTATLIRTAQQQVRESGALTLLFDNGDSLQGTPFGEWAAEEKGSEHPLMKAFGLLGYDAIGLGNHDFSFGLLALDSILSQAPCPVVCSNMKYSTGDQSWQEYAILRRSLTVANREFPIQIGVLSVLPPQTAQWEAHRLMDQVTVADIMSSARRTASRLRQMGCDLVIALAHSGLGQSDAATGLENAVIPMAAIDEIDAIIAGHTHLTLPGKNHDELEHVENHIGRIHGKPVVMPGFAGSHLGIIDVAVEREPSGRWRIVNSSSLLQPICSANENLPVPEDAELKKVFSHGHAHTRARMAESVGQTSKPLHSFFSYCAHDRGLALVAAAQAAALRPFLSGTKFATLPVLSATAPSKFGGRAGPNHYTHVPAGEISMRHVADLHVFPNELRAICVSGAQLLDWIEMSAGIFNQLDKSHEAELNDPRRAGHNFDVLHGVSYEIDLSQPARFSAGGQLINPTNSRICNLRHRGSPVEQDQEFIVTLNNYRVSGGGHFPFPERVEAIKLPPLRIQDILRDYLSGKLPADPLEKAPRPFSFTGQPGSLAIFRTGPGAADYLQELAEYEPQILDQDPDGFLRIRLSL
ncbi:bifunctional 2',3'-cyclic-nucleotide 2'-phosphodiesterase/3'-nucleotidase [Ruegeria arenilitoris]|uniref:bifunctional 2',3'-cyclic-nucleotide 2'-phosphodiesterase/3'-nucleotidase n=1 Tax=Ruegeria arenilitoris TaxID=1173585 RepID=UPI0034638F87